MRTLTLTESKQWCVQHTIELDSRGLPLYPAPEFRALRCRLPGINQLTWFSRLVSTSLQPRARCLLWVTGWGIWPSSENWHLYYRLRESHGDRGAIQDTPAHLFLEHEADDEVTFIEAGILFGWDMYLLPSRRQGLVFVSHDEFAVFMMEAGPMAKCEAELRDAGLVPVAMELAPSA